MNKNYLLITLVLLWSLILTSCSPRLRVGALQSESQSVELGDAKSVNVDINFGAGSLDITGEAEKLLEASFTYNVAKLKPEVKYADGKLVVQQPDNKGFPALGGISDFRNEWNLRFNNEVPMELNINMGAGTSNLNLASLTLSGLSVRLGAGESTLDLSGDWANDLDVNIDTGASVVTVRLPKDIGVRVEVDAGPTAIDSSGLTKDGNVYTNAAYGVSDVTLRISIDAGIGQLNLEVAE